MIIGTCSWTLGSQDVDAIFARCAAMELDGVQYCEDLNLATPEQVLAAARAHNQRVLAVDPFNCGPRAGSDASPESGLHFYRRVIDFAQALGNVPATMQGLPQWLPAGLSAKESHGALVHMVHTLHAYAAERGVRVLYEAVNRYESPAIRTAEEGLRLLSDAGVGHPGLILDSFHMHIEEADPVAAIRSAAGKLASYHISDSNRGALGAGQVDFASQRRALAEAGFDGLVMIELVLPQLVPSTPPGSDEQRSLLDRGIVLSLAKWRQLAES